MALFEDPGTGKTFDAPTVVTNENNEHSRAKYYAKQRNKICHPRFSTCTPQSGAFDTLAVDLPVLNP
jgi:hypothetical protein